MQPTKPNDPSTWSASDRDLAVQMIASLAELLGCPPSNVEAEVRRLIAHSATLKRAADPSILADLEIDGEETAPSLPYLAKSYQWAKIVRRIVNASQRDARDVALAMDAEERGQSEPAAGE